MRWNQADSSSEEAPADSPKETAMQPYKQK